MINADEDVAENDFVIGGGGGGSCTLIGLAFILLGGATGVDGGGGSFVFIGEAVAFIPFSETIGGGGGGNFLPSCDACDNLAASGSRTNKPSDLTPSTGFLALMISSSC